LFPKPTFEGVVEVGSKGADTPSVRRLVALVLVVVGVVGAATPVSADDGGIPPGEFRVRAALSPNDPSYQDDPADSSASDYSQWGPPLLGMEEVWSDTTGSSSTIIAVVDSGVRNDGKNPNLNGRVLKGRDIVYDDDNPDDPYGHGTFVATIAAGRGNDGYGMAGYCWQCKVLPVRVLDGAGEGHTGWVAEGVRWAADHGADIINLSLTGPSSFSLQSAVAYARNRGILIVAAAGNDDPKVEDEDLTAPQYPAALPGVISVAASTASDQLYPWSYRGSQWVRVAAPGCVFNLDRRCGTSYAAPAVAGILAAGLAVAPCATDDALMGALYATASQMPGNDVQFGRVDAASFRELVQAEASTSRIAGSSRIATAIAISRRAYPDAPAVVLARSDRYVDALAAAPLAAKIDGPVLLTPRDELPDSVAEEIARLGATTVWLAGGSSALSQGVVDGLEDMGFVMDSTILRRSGDTSFATAGAIALEVGDGLTDETVYIASVESFPDGVAVSSLAAATNSPVLLVAKDGVPTPTVEALADLDPARVVLVGGERVISRSVEESLAQATGLTIERISGESRYETSKYVGEQAPGHIERANVWVATGENWPDALAAGPAAAAAGGVLLLGDPDTSAAMVQEWIGTYDATRVTVAGGPNTLSDATVCSLDQAIAAGP
jgi:putative cell wall-binding protein